MGIRKVVEFEADGPSVIVWEGGKGTRVIYKDADSADRACTYLISKANQFHIAKESNDGSEDELMVTIECFGERMTEFAFVKHYLSVVRSAGFEVQAGLVRSQGEYW